MRSKIAQTASADEDVAWQMEMPCQWVFLMFEPQLEELGPDGLMVGILIMYDLVVKPRKYDPQIHCRWVVYEPSTSGGLLLGRTHSHSGTPTFGTS